MMIELIITSFVIAFLRGGRIDQIPKFNKLYALIISIFLQVGAGFLVGWSNWLISFAYLFTLLFFFFNKEFEDIRIFMVGWFLNALAIWSNYGRMPVDFAQVSKTPWAYHLTDGSDYKHSLITDMTNLPFLSDIIYLPYPIPRVISIGDIFLIIASFLLVQRIMNKPISLLKVREGK